MLLEKDRVRRRQPTLNSGEFAMGKFFLVLVWSLCIVVPGIASAQSDRSSLWQLNQWQGALSNGSGRSDFKDASGRSTGSASRTGNTITFRDASGRTTGTATIVGGRATFRDASGRTVGSSRTNAGPSGGSNTVIRSQSGRTLGQARDSRDGRVQFRDSSGRTIGSSQSSSGRIQFRDSSGRSTGSMVSTRPGSSSQFGTSTRDSASRSSTSKTLSGNKSKR